MTKSDSIKELASALCKFQAEVANILKTSENPYFKSKYAKLEDILNEYRHIWTKYGLSISQHPISDENGRIGVQTEVYHNSGEYRIFPPFYLTLTKNDPQGGGSAITYARRYSLAAVLGIQQEDDDGETHRKADTKLDKDNKIIEAKQLKIQGLLTKYTKENKYGFDKKGAGAEFVKEHLATDRISACRDLDFLNVAVDILEDLPNSYKPTLEDLQKMCEAKLVELNYDPTHKKNSIIKWLGDDCKTIADCDDYDTLATYLKHLNGEG